MMQECELRFYCCVENSDAAQINEMRLKEDHHVCGIRRTMLVETAGTV